MTARDVRALLARCALGRPLLVWDGERFHHVTPEALRGALPLAEAQRLKEKG